MRKDRNTFFEQQSYNSGFFPSPNYNMPSITSTSSESFYQNPYANYNNDIDSRLAKLERQVNRLETRINQMESNNTLKTTNDDYNMNTSKFFNGI